MWVRGLKQHDYNARNDPKLSHPVWVRGLKLIVSVWEKVAHIVAPRVGAWIETSSLLTTLSITVVAPRVGAWIETHPRRPLRPHHQVAPRVGAWIETVILTFSFACGMSHPVWVRGLKPLIGFMFIIFSCRTPCGCVD